MWLRGLPGSPSGQSPPGTLLSRGALSAVIREKWKCWAHTRLGSGEFKYCTTSSGRGPHRSGSRRRPAVRDSRVTFSVMLGGQGEEGSGGPWPPRRGRVVLEARGCASRDGGSTGGLKLLRLLEPLYPGRERLSETVLTGSLALPTRCPVHPGAAVGAIVTVGLAAASPRRMHGRQGPRRSPPSPQQGHPVLRPILSMLGSVAGAARGGSVIWLSGGSHGQE